MEQIRIDVYRLDELAETSKKRAIRDFNKNFGYLQDKPETDEDKEKFILNGDYQFLLDGVLFDTDFYRAL